MTPLPHAAPSSYAKRLASGEQKLITSFNALEADIVLEARKGGDRKRELDLLLHACGVEVVPFDHAMLTVYLFFSIIVFLYPLDASQCFNYNHSERRRLHG